MLNNRQQGRRRGRGRGSPGNNGGGRQDNGSRIDNRARGNAPQMLEKYKNLAREAQLQGDRVLTEYYLQFADHYFRIVAESRARSEDSRPPRRDDWQNEDGDEGENLDMSDGESAAYGNEGNDEPAPAPAQRDRRPTREKREFRPRRDEGPASSAPRESAEESTSIDAAVLPPALGVSADPIVDLDAEPAPRRRGRPRRAAVSDAETEAAE